MRAGIYIGLSSSAALGLIYLLNRRIGEAIDDVFAGDCFGEIPPEGLAAAVDGSPGGMGVGSTAAKTQHGGTRTVAARDHI